MNTELKSAESATNAGSARRRGLTILGIVVAAGIVGWFAYWYLHGRYFVSTDDAYVAGDVVQVNAEVGGTISAVHVHTTESVARGQLLLELDPADAQVAMDAAVADLAATVRQVQGLYSQTGRLQAQIEARQAELERAEDDYKRRTALVADGAVSTEELVHSRQVIAVLKASLAAARDELAATRAQTQGTTAATHPQVQRVAARVREAGLALSRTQVRSPVTGLVGRRAVQAGQRIAAGTPLLAVVPLDNLWVDANFKEGQLERMRIGQPATLSSDLYGRSVTYHGRVIGISPGTGSVFALLPPQNASGNWIKIVQRLPVRIALDPAELAASPLRVGLSMTAEVDLHDQSGPALEAPGKSATSAPVAARDPAIEALITRTIADSVGRGGVGSR